MEFWNKKGTEKILSIWWFFSLGIIAAGIVLGVLIYYSEDVDIRELEADILSERILNCITEQGYLQDFAVSGLTNEILYENCNLDKEMFDTDNYYFKLMITTETEQDPIKAGPNYEVACDIFLEGEVEDVHSAKCVLKKETVFYNSLGETKKGEVELLTASNQEGGRIPIK